MRIQDIEVINLRFAYSPDRCFQYAGGLCTGRLSTLIRVRTDSSLVGLGSVYSHPDLVRTIVRGQLRPALVGEDPSNVEELWNRCYSRTRWYGRKGAAMSALGVLNSGVFRRQIFGLFRQQEGAVSRIICDV
ncbi:MAG: hypothetical protein OXC19_21825 [Bryobacterales bacterium]|nr:hypothetical protein [Bryobacterales bacterium]